MIESLSDANIKRVELLLKIIGTILTILTIFIGIFQYFHKLSHENYMEFKRSIWKQQIETYSEACRYAGLIAMNPDGPDFNKNLENFGGLYWGEMIVVEDSMVRHAMKDFYYAAYYDFEPKDPHSRNKLKFKAEKLAEACKSSSRDSWSKLKPE